MKNKQEVGNIRDGFTRSFPLMSAEERGVGWGGVGVGGLMGGGGGYKFDCLHTELVSSASFPETCL